MTDGIIAFAGAMLIRALIDSVDEDAYTRLDAETWMRGDFGALVIAVLDAEIMVNGWLRLSLPERQERLASVKIKRYPVGARSNDRINGITETA